MKPSYYVKSDGTIVMDFHVFKVLKPDALERLLTHRGTTRKQGVGTPHKKYVQKRLELAFSL